MGLKKGRLYYDKNSVLPGTELQLFLMQFRLDGTANIMLTKYNVNRAIYYGAAL